jgi:hypothetical protein
VKKKSYLEANSLVAMLASSLTMLWLLWKFPLATVIATVGVVALLLVSARLAATSSDAEPQIELDHSDNGVGLR